MKKILKPLVMIFLIMNLSGCGMMMMQQQQQDKNDFSEQQEPTSSDSDLSSDASSELDSSEPFSGEKRIVSLIPSNTEILDALDMDDEIVGITTVDTYPEALTEDPEVDKLDAFEFDIEQLLALKPTHILSHESSRAMHEEVLEQISDQTDAEVLYVEEAETVDGIPETIKEIGRFLGESEKADEAAAGLENDIEEIAHNSQGDASDDAVIQISRSPEFYTTGNNTFLDDALEKVDVNNTFDDLTGFTSVSIETVIERNPDYIISVSGVDTAGLNDEVAEFPGIENMTIKSEDRQCAVDPDIITRPGPRITEGLAEISACLNR